MTMGDRRDPYLSLRFRVEITGIEIGAFSEVTGLQVEIETEEYREGGVNDYIHKLAGPARYPANIVLKHGLLDYDEFWKWQQAMIEGNADHRKVSIVLLDNTGRACWRWDFRDACPVRWSGPDLRGGTAEVAIETLELVHRGVLASTGRPSR